MKKILLIVIPIILLLGAVSFGIWRAKSAVKDFGSGGLVGYWTMDANDKNGTNYYDRSGKNNTAVSTGSPTLVPGTKNQALSFSGSGQYLSAVSSNSLKISNTITLSAWIKPSASDSCSNTGIIYKGTFATAQGDYAMQCSSNVEYFTLNVMAHQMRTTNPVIVIGQWQFLTETYDGTTMRIYYNGVEQATTCTAGTCSPASITTSDNNVIIGGYYNTSYLFNGVIDDARIYNYALSAQQVADLYNSAKTTYVNSAPKTASSTAQLVGWWTMDAGDMNGTTVYDRSGRNSHGTSANTPTKVAGKINQAMSFNGSSDWVNAGTSVGNYINDFTLSAWVKTATYNTRIVARRGGADLTQYDFHLDATDGSLALYDGSVVRDSGVAIGDNKWHLATVAISGANSKFYVDGVQAGNAFTPSIASQNLNFEIGAIYDGAAGQMNGYLDDVRIYNYALTAQEVSNLYNSAAKKYVYSAPKEGLVGYWTMDAGDATSTPYVIYDRSGKNNNATSTFTPTFVAGKMNQAITFPGNKYMSVVNSASLNPTASITASAWIKPTAGVSYDIVLSKPFAGAGGGNEQYEIMRDNVGGHIIFAVKTSGGMYYAYSNTTWASILNKWTLVTGIHNGSQIYIYVNGRENTGSRTGSNGTLSTDVGPLGIGGTGGSYQPFTGTIDDVRIYNRALSAAEVAQLYSAAKINYVR